MNATDDFAKSLKCTYKEFPEHFVWYPSSKSWQPRKQKDSIGRIVAANPLEGERYFLRLLLLQVRAPTSYDDLKTVNGVHVTTFREAAVLRGYLESNNSQDECLEEAAVYHMPYSLRRLFATLLVYFTPSNPRSLWLKFEESLSKDYNRLPNITKSDIQFKDLHQISNFLESMGRNINNYGLVPRVLKFHDSNTDARDTISETEIKVSEDDLVSITKLNLGQKAAFDTIMQALYIKGKGCFFIDGPGGTGKTFLYRALLAEVRSKGFIALATASCGVAASILPGGRTTHSRFKIPIDMNSANMCKISKQSALAKLIQAAKLIIWDEAPMAHKTGIEGVDTLLKDLMGSSELFGSKIMVFGGDFRQVLPIVSKGSKEDFVQASLVTSYIWPQLHKLYLTDNMRAISDPEFTDYLLRIGNGLEPVIQGLKVKIPLPLLIPYKNETESIFELIKTVYPDLTAFSKNDFSLVNRAILTTKNEFVDMLNNLLINIFPVISAGEFKGKQVFLHRISFRIENNPDCPMSFERVQFPVRLCFAMTINKAQGQTLDFVGIYLREPAFSHGQLYVALSRAKSSNCVKILIQPSPFDPTVDYATNNIVYKHILQLANHDPS
ncbi:uncharacterized protein [Coffea arabica]|uniref:ATP-dependent DNA helicase n=1 Tax=Coffea arabica TaxID=13443 RepID=A0A6P6VK45_COFAR|nr:ATP-dependent DNA helicase PIF1-like [Coffea arabica]